MRKEPPKGNESPREKNHQWKITTKGKKGPPKENTDGKESPSEKRATKGNEPPREKSRQGKNTNET